LNTDDNVKFLENVKESEVEKEPEAEEDVDSEKDFDFVNDIFGKKVGEEENAEAFEKALEAENVYEHVIPLKSDDNITAKSEGS
jgi:hypothetical protein